MSINMIACIDISRAIGNKGSLLTKPPLDFKHFKELTYGGFVVFGKTTFEEIGKPLSGRQNIVLSRNPKIKLPEGVYHYQSVEDILFEYHNHGDSSVPLWICGGEKVYKEFLPHANKIYLTIVNHVFPDSDRYFPEFSLDKWEVVDNVKNSATEDYPHDYYFISYKRRLLQLEV